jgi:hypothetical protein
MTRIIANSHKFILLALIFLAACSPAATASSGDGIVRAVLFYTPGCSSCENTLKNTLPPLQSRYGAQLQVQLVPLNNLDEVNRLYDTAAFFKLSKEQIQVPFVVIGSTTIIGEEAVAKELEGKIKAGIAAGGYAQPALPAPLAELAARPTSTPRPTLPALLQPPGVGAQPTATSAK